MIQILQKVSLPLNNETRSQQLSKLTIHAAL